MTTFLVSLFPSSKSGQLNNQNLVSIIGNDKNAISLSSQIKTGRGNEDAFFNYLQIIKDKGDLPLATEYSNPFTKKNIQITNESCYGEIAFTIWNFICFLINKTSAMPVGSQEDLLKITPILSDLNALSEDLKFVSKKLNKHAMFSQGFVSFVESFINFMNAQQLLQIAVFKKNDNGILKSGGTLLNQLNNCQKYLGSLDNTIQEYFRPEIKALIQYFNAYLYYTAACVQIKALQYGNAVSSLRAASRILNPDNQTKTKWFHGSAKSDEDITPSIKNQRDILSNQIEPMLKSEEANNRKIYAQVIPDDPPALPAAYKLNLFNPTPELLFYCTVDIPSNHQERYKITTPTQSQNTTKQSPSFSPQPSQQQQFPQQVPQQQQQQQQIHQQLPLSQASQYSPQSSQPQFTQQHLQQPQFTQQFVQQPQFNQQPQFGQQPQFTQPIQFTQQPPQFNQQAAQNLYLNQQNHYPSMPINAAFPNLDSSDVFNKPNQQYVQYPSYQNQQQQYGQYMPQSFPDHYNQTMNNNSFLPQRSHSGGIPCYTPPQSGPLLNCGSSPQFSVPNNYPQVQVQDFNQTQQPIPQPPIGGPPVFVPTADPQSDDSDDVPNPTFAMSQKVGHHPWNNGNQQASNNTQFMQQQNFNHSQYPTSTHSISQRPKKGAKSGHQPQNNGYPVFTQTSGAAPPVFTPSNQENQHAASQRPKRGQKSQKPQQGSNGAAPPVFTQQGSNGGPPVFTQQGSSGGAPPVFTQQQGSNGGPPVFTQQGSGSGAPPVFTQPPPQQGSNGGPPVFTQQGSSSGAPPVFTQPPPQQGSGGGPPVFTPSDQPPAPVSGGQSQPSSSSSAPPSFPQANLSGPPQYTPFDQLSASQIFPSMTKLQDLKQDVAMKIVDLSGTSNPEIMNMVNMYAQQLSQAAESDQEIDKLIEQYKQPGHSGIQQDFIEKAINGAIGFYSSIQEQLMKVKQHI